LVDIDEYAKELSRYIPLNPVRAKMVETPEEYEMYLCQRYTGNKLKEIGLQFGIGESGISQACRRVANKIEKDKKLKKMIERLEKQINLSRMKT